jgi:hypothetical protein
VTVNRLGDPLSEVLDWGAHELAAMEGRLAALNLHLAGRNSACNALVVGHMPSSTKRKLLQAIEVLWEVSRELHARKPFFSNICRSLAEALTRCVEEKYHRFIFDLPARTSTVIDSSVRPDAPTYRYAGSVRVSPDSEDDIG